VLIPPVGETGNRAIVEGYSTKRQKREFHIKLGKKGVLAAIGVRRLDFEVLRDLVPLAIVIDTNAMDCVSPKAVCREWQLSSYCHYFRPNRIKEEEPSKIGD